MPYTITFHDKTDNYIRNIEDVPDEIGNKMITDAQRAKAHKELYEFKPGDICKYKGDVGDCTVFCLIKIWFEDVDIAYFNAVDDDGDVIASGNLDLVKKIDSCEEAYKKFMEDIRKVDTFI